MTLQDWLNASNGSVLIHRYGSANWYCRNGNCGGIAERIEDIVHAKNCPIRGVIIHSFGEDHYPSGEVPEELKHGT